MSFLKRQNDTYEPKKSKVLSMENITNFFNSASDDDYLLIKVVIILALHGACRRSELWKLEVNDVQDTAKMLVVTLKGMKTNRHRTFTVTEDLNGYNLCKKYMQLRPKNVQHKFFLFYKNCKCTVQRIGINSFAKIPQRVAEYLHLPDAKAYTGHCLRRTSATFLADSGADILMLKRHGGWRSNAVAEGYVDESINNKLEISKNIFKQAADDNISCEKKCDEASVAVKTDIEKKTTITSSTFQSCTFNIYNK